MWTIAAFFGYGLLCLFIADAVVALVEAYQRAAAQRRFLLRMRSRSTHMQRALDGLRELRAESEMPLWHFDRDAKSLRMRISKDANRRSQ